MKQLPIPCNSGQKRNPDLSLGWKILGATVSLLVWLLFCGIFVTQKSTKLEAALSPPRAPQQASNLQSQGEGKTKKLMEPERGLVSSGTYKNELLGFTYQFPKGWNVRSPEELKDFDKNLARDTLAYTSACLLYTSPSPRD